MDLEQWALEHPDWREQANKEVLYFAAIQIRYALKHRDIDAISHWGAEIVSELGVYKMSDDEMQGIVDRHFANLILNIGDEKVNEEAT